MMKRSTTSLALGVAMLFLATFSAQAQVSPRSNTGFFLGLKGGVALYSGDFADVEDSFSNIGMNIAGELGYRFSPRFQLHLQGQRAVYSNIEVPNRTSDDDTRYSALAYLQYNILPQASVNPYLMAGVMTTLGYPIREVGQKTSLRLGRVADLDLITHSIGADRYSSLKPSTSVNRQMKLLTTPRQ